MGTQTLETNDVLNLTNETLKLSKISGLDYATTTDYMTTAIRGFKMEMEEASTVVDVYSALAANTAVSQQELAEAMTRTASSMESVGSTFEETSAMIATIVAVTRESANNIGSAMKSIASRYGELTKDPMALLDSEGEVMSFNRVDTALQSIGISMQTVDGQFRDFTDVIIELGEKWNDLESTQQRYIATQFAGNRQQSRFLALVSNVDQLKDNLDVAANSEDIGDLQALTTLDSLESKINQVQVAYQQFYTTLGAENLWKGALDGIKNYIDTLNGLPKVFGKIPLNAIAMIGNLVGLVKNVLFKGLSTIASTWQNIIQTANTQANEAGKTGGQQIGQNWVQAVASGIKSNQANVTMAMQGALGQGTGNVPIASLEAGMNQFSTYSKTGLLTYNASNISEEAATTLENTFIQMQESGVRFSQSTSEQILTITDSVRAGETSFKNAVFQINNILQSVGAELDKESQKANNFWSQLGNKNSQISRNAMSIAQGFTLVGMAIDKSSASGRVFSGVLTGLGGTIQTISSGARVFARDLSALPGLAMGILNIFNGISLAWEDPQEKLERLTKEAENLSNISKQVKSDYKTLDASIEKYKKLKEERYESAEAAEEYQTTVDELASRFPQMIEGFDEAGNVIINTTNAEAILANARLKSAQATYEAAEAELIAKQQEQKIQQSVVEGATNDFVDMVTNYVSSINSSLEYHSAERELGAIAYGYDNQIFTGEEQGWINLAYNPDYDFLQKFIETEHYGPFGMLTSDKFDLEGFEAALKDPSWINEIKENYQDQIELIQRYYDEIEGTASSQTDTLEEELEELTNSAEALRSVDPNSTEFKNQLIDFKDEVTRVDEQYNLGGQLIDTFIIQYDEIFKNLDALSTSSSEIDSWSRQTISAWINTIETNEGIFNFLAESAELGSFATRAIYQDVENKKVDWIKYKEKYQDSAAQILTEYQTFWDSLAPSDKELFQKMTSDTSSYTADDIIRTFKLDSIFPQIKDIIYSYYEDGANSIRERMEESWKKKKKDIRDTNITDSIDNFLDARNIAFSTDEESYFQALTDNLLKLSESNFDDKAKNIASAGISIFETLDKIDVSNSELSNTILDTILKNGLTTIEGLESSIKAIEDNDTISSDYKKSLIDSLINIRDNIVQNFALSVQTAISDFGDNWEDDSAEITKLSSGMTISEVSNFLPKARTLGIEISSDDFTSNGEKLVLANEKIDEYFEAYQESLNNSLSDWISVSNTVIDWLSDDNKVDPNAISDYLKNHSPEELNTLLSNIGFNINDETLYNLNKNEITTEGFIVLSEAISSYTQNVQDLNQLMYSAGVAINQAREFAEGNYESANIIDAYQAQKLASGEWELDKTSYARRAAKEQLNSAYDSLISDVLSKGFENINLADYSGLYDAGKDIDLSGSYVDFVQKYASWTGKTIEEINSLIIDAIEKDNQSTIGVADAFKDITFINKDIAYASIDTLQSIADSLGIAVTELFDPNSYNSIFEGYQVNLSKINIDGIANIEEMITDSINNYINSITDLISKGLSGSLTNIDITTLKGQLGAIGLNNIELDFSKTTEGLKLSQESAFALYQELKKVDGLRAQLVFDDLIDSLNKAGSGYENISQTTAKVVELQREITKKENDITQAQKVGAPSEWIDSENAKINKLKQELSLTQEIQRVQSQDPSSYDFMGRDLPDYLKGPQNYWNSVGEAFDVMNQSSQSGYMEIQDFYNIINEMSNLANIAGNTLEFMGQKIDGSAENAASLIEWGLGALSNIDAEGVKIDLSKLGTDIFTGAEDMGKGFDNAVKSMAQSQIHMLDGMIKLLETIVAMEKLGDIDVDENGIFSIGDIFKLDTEGNPIPEYTKEYETYVEDLIELAETDIDLANALDSVTINGYSVRDMLDDAADGLKDLNISEEAYFSAIDALRQAAISGDYDLDNLMNSITEVLAGTGETFEIDIGDTKVAIGYGVAIEANEDGTYTVGSERYENVEEALQAKILDDLGNVSNIEIETDDESVTATGNLTVGKQTIQVSTTDGKITYTDGIYTDTTLRGLLHQQFIGQGGIEGDVEGEQSYINATYGVDVYEKVYATSIKITNEEDFKNTTQSQLNSLATALVSGTDQEVIEAASKVGIDVSVTGKLTADERSQIAELAGIESKTVALNLALNLTGDGSEAIKNLGIEDSSFNTTVNFTTGTDETGIIKTEEGTTKSIDVEVNFKAGTDETGLKLGSLGENGLQITDPVNATVTDLTVNATNAKYDGILTLTEDISEGKGNITNLTVGATTLTPTSGLTQLQGMDFSTTSQSLLTLQTRIHNISSQSFSNFGGLSIQLNSIVGQVQTIWEYVQKFANQTFTVNLNTNGGSETNTTVNQTTNETVNIDTSSAIAACQALSSAAQAAAGPLYDTAGKINELAIAARKLPDKSNAVNNLANAMMRMPNIGSRVSSLANAMKQIPNVASRITTLNKALNRIPSSKNISITATVNVKATGTGVSLKSQTPSSNRRNPITWNKAKGNVALAKGAGNAAAGRKTLMGELGPELVVSGGRYFIVGENGAEFVNLAPDAIVFNHLQTEDLLKRGRSSHGSPVTTESRAVSFATGNVEGPAMASASAALAALKQIRAMWQSMLDASAKELGSQAGRGGSGGGGGGDGGSGNDPVTQKNVTSEIQRWYNLLRQIAKIEEQISYQESLQNKIQSDRLANGRALYISYQKELNLLDKQIDRNKQLAELQKSWYDNKRKELEESSYGLIFTYDEEGLMQYVDNTPGSGRGLDILENLTRRDVKGQAIGHAATAETQLNYLKSLGFNIADLIYNDDGTFAAKYNSKGQLISSEDNTVLKDQALADAQAAMMENFWNNVDGWMEELDSLYDSYHEQQNKVLENQSKQNEILQKLVDNQISVENDILKAIEAREQARIDELQDERDALQESTDKFLNGLEEQLNREKSMYQQNQNAEELTKLQRQLAILQRSGGSASQIRNLQNQIDAKQQDAYFNKQQEQIDAIREASDKQIEKMDHQIDLMTETLEYQKENGLLWREVREIMMMQPEEVISLLQQWDPDYRSKSELQISEDLRDFKLRFETWIGEREEKNIDDAFNSLTSEIEKVWESAGFSLTDSIKNKARDAFNNTWAETGDIDKATAAAKAIYDSAYNEEVTKKPVEDKPQITTPVDEPEQQEPVSTGGKVTVSSGARMNIRKGPGSGYKSIKTIGAGTYDYTDRKGDWVYIPEFGGWMNGKYKKYTNWVGFDTGGYTGNWNSEEGRLAIVHKKELILNKDDTKNFLETVEALRANKTNIKYLNDNLTANSNTSLISLLDSFQEIMKGIANQSTYNSINRTESIIIEEANVNMNVDSIGSDYDARRAGEAALDQMVKIARKAGNRNVTRR